MITRTVRARLNVSGKLHTTGEKMKPRLAVADVLAQVVITAVIHWMVSPEWTTSAFLERAGFTVPAALVFVAVWHAWRERGVETP